VIKSCQECKTKCCKTGPGPYRRVLKYKYLKNFESHKNYNVACASFDLKTEKCSLWGTHLLPLDCRVYVCHSREYSKQELFDIKNFKQLTL